ncbi:unnamed protein product [Brassica napus]|uniref:(rape) hypothetical protein n=1 Tax=Brassica napus TaxID=3708 RepID=A0A816KWB4_BRANA|nr:unnamed protein product [Brassica napus]
MDYRPPLYLFFSLPYKENSQWEQVSSLVYSLHACPIQPGSVLKLDRLARWKLYPPARSYYRVPLGCCILRQPSLQ